MSDKYIGNFLLFNPKSNKPPRKVFATYEEVIQVAEECAAKYEGGKVYVMQCLALAELAPPPVRTKTINDVAAERVVSAFFGEVR